VRSSRALPVGEGNEARGQRNRVRLLAAAEADFAAILEWTAEHFGLTQASRYAKVLLSALDALKEGPKALGVKPQRALGAGIFTLHVARRGRRGRHIIVFRAEPKRKGEIQVLRILHDSMDIVRHIVHRIDADTVD
jgi:toxin ParE1/3/4